MALPEGDHVVNGLLSSYEVKNGWHKFSILEEGKQYPVKADTKKPDVINAAMALGNQQVSAQITRKDSGNPNPNQPGTNFINTYLNAIGPLSAGSFPQPQAQPQQQAAPQQAQGFGQQQQPAQGQQQGFPQQPQQQAQPQGFTQEQQAPRDPFSPDARDLKIYRQVAWKSAVQLAIAEKIPFNPADIVAAAEVGMGYLVYGPARFGVTAFDGTFEEAAADQQPEAETQPEAPEPEQAPLPDNPPQHVNTELVPCAQCGAVPGEFHAADCIPF